MWCFIAFLPFGAPSKAYIVLLRDERGRFHCELDLFGPVGVAIYEKFLH